MSISAMVADKIRHRPINERIKTRYNMWYYLVDKGYYMLYDCLWTIIINYIYDVIFSKDCRENKYDIFSFCATNDYWKFLLIMGC